jgi:hypothetical protein
MWKVHAHSAASNHLSRRARSCSPSRTLSIDSTESDESDASRVGIDGKLASSALDLRELLPVRLLRYLDRDDADGDRANAVS